MFENAVDAEHATLNAHDERRRRALNVLYAISERSRGKTDFRLIFSSIAEELRELFPYDACYIAVCDRDRPGIFRAALLIDEGFESYEVSTEYGHLTGLLVQQRQPILFGDLAAERTALPHSPVMFGNLERESRAWMGVPLIFANQTIGILSLQSYLPNLYSADDVELLQQIGNLAATVIENVSLLQNQQLLSEALAAQVEARTRELHVLGELAAEMVRERRLPELLERSLQLALELFDSDAAVIRLINPATGELDLAVHQGMPTSYVMSRARLPLQDSYIGQAIMQRKPLIVGLDQIGPLRERGLPYQSLISVPLLLGEQVLGGMTVLSESERLLDEQQVAVVEALANQVAIAIENARLFAERDRRVAELLALSTIARVAGTASSMAAMQREVHAALAELLPLDTFTMVGYDPQRHLITDGISIDEGRESNYWQRQPPPPDSLTAWVLRQRQTLHFDNLEQEIGSYPGLAVRHTVGSARHAVSWVGVPLLNRDNEAIGAISVQSYREAAFSDLDVRLLSNIASQIALHTQHMSLLLRRERQIRELDAISQISRHVNAAITLGEMMRPTYEILQHVTDASSFFLIICDPDTGLISNSFFIDGGEEVAQTWPENRPPQGSLSAWI
ncbi:MAG TPA: GAF domain-containing protein, partial [Roseiflexaceae bacterium]|nr:GAF domain-containing protein [Roseiflexaceae bacterium]